MSVESIMTALGYVVANWVGYGASFSKTSFQWRFPLAVQVLFALLVFCAAPFLPESPRWLIEQGQEDHAFELVKKLHFTGQNSVFIQREFQEMRDQILAEKEQTVRSYKDVFTKPSWRRRVLLACGVWIGVSLSGITVVNFYCECNECGTQAKLTECSEHVHQESRLFDAQVPPSHRHLWLRGSYFMLCCDDLPRSSPTNQDAVGW